jgi:hypothetical protein
VIHLKPKKEINYLRKHDLTIEEICESPLFNGLSDEEIAPVRETFLDMCHILFEMFGNENIELESNKHHSITGQMIELNPSKSKAA